MARYPSSLKKQEWVSRAWEPGKVAPKVPRPIPSARTAALNTQTEAARQASHEQETTSSSHYDSSAYSESPSSSLALATTMLVIAAVCG